MRKVALSRWKQIPGVFLWIMLVLCPGSKNDKKGRFVRRKMAVAGLSMGFDDFQASISYLRAFWLVERWITSNKMKDEPEEDSEAVDRPKAVKKEVDEANEDAETA
jgi:hypothetical protein